MEIPVPIPNTEVKHIRAKGSECKNRTLPRLTLKSIQINWMLFIYLLIIKALYYELSV